MKKIFPAVLFIFGLIFLKPNNVLATCDSSKCDCTEHPIINTPCSPSYCEIRSPTTGTDNGGNLVVVYYCGTAKQAGGINPLQVPKDWLKNVSPGFIPPWGVNFGLDFFTKQLVPFLVWAGVFFTMILSLAFLIIGGIMYSVAGGNKEGMTKAKGTITYAIVGLVLGLSSFIILAILGNFFGVNLTGASTNITNSCPVSRADYNKFCVEKQPDAGAFWCLLAKNKCNY